jgi:hypothetical protein
MDVCRVAMELHGLDNFEVNERALRMKEPKSYSDLAKVCVCVCAWLIGKLVGGLIHWGGGGDWFGLVGWLVDWLTMEGMFGKPSIIIINTSTPTHIHVHT